MICPKCGAQCPDGTKFCTECGSDLSAVPQSAPMTEPMGAGISDLSNPVSSIPQPVSSAVPQPSAFGTQSQTDMSMGQTGQSAFGGQPGMSAGQPGQSPFGAQPGQGSYIPPQTYGPVTPVKKSNKMPIIIGACVAVVAVFLILLFTVILPNIGGGGLAHKWSATKDGVTMTYDLKNNEVETMGFSMPIEWEDKGNGKLTITMSFMGMSQTEELDYELNGNTLILTGENGVPIEFTRAD